MAVDIYLTFLLKQITMHLITNTLNMNIFVVLSALFYHTTFNHAMHGQSLSSNTMVTLVKFLQADVSVIHCTSCSNTVIAIEILHNSMLQF